MKSPFTGGEASLQKEMRTMEFRKEEFDVLFHYYLCGDSKEQFTDDDLDEVNINQIYNKYRAKYGIPFPDEIKAIREQYGLPATKMSEILGLGINVYRNYEGGEVPSVSNGRLIQMIRDPKEFRRLIDYGKNEFSAEELEKITRKINIALAGWSDSDSFSESLILGEIRPTILNGYKAPSLDRICNMVLFFAQNLKPFKTKLNKLLFYADFLNFKKTCFSISGITYQAIQKGPVPKNYDWIYDKSMEKRLVKIVLHDYGDYMGEQFVTTGEAEFDKEAFTESELGVMKAIVDSFKNDTVNQIVNKSHQEAAWLDNIQDYAVISYDYGFELKYPARP